IPVYLIPHFLPTHPALAGLSTLSLHDALPISSRSARLFSNGTGRSGGGSFIATRLLRIRAGGADACSPAWRPNTLSCEGATGGPDRKSTRLNSSHDQISYAVFCLKKKNVHQL